MNYTSNNCFSEYPSAQHKPRVRFNSEYNCYQCSDGGLTLYGNTESEAYSELMKCRGE